MTPEQEERLVAALEKLARITNMIDFAFIGLCILIAGCIVGCPSS